MSWRAVKDVVQLAGIKSTADAQAEAKERRRGLLGGAVGSPIARPCLSIIQRSFVFVAVIQREQILSPSGQRSNCGDESRRCLTWVGTIVCLGAMLVLG